MKSNTPPTGDLPRLLRVLLTWSLVLSAVCVATGRWQPHLVSDSASYLEYPFSPPVAVASQIRSPAYPLLLHISKALTPSQAAAFQVVVIFQILLHAFAVSLLMVELQAWGIQRAAAVAAAAAVAIGCSFWDNVSTIATDCPAMSVGVIVATCVLRGWRIGFSLPLAFSISLLCLFAIALRPAYLFLLPWVAVMLLLRTPDGRAASSRRRLLDACIAVVIPMVVLLTWCGFRYQTVRDFSLLPFGHQNMAAVTTQLLDNEELQQLSGQVGVLASEIAQRRVAVALGTIDPKDGTARLRADGLDLRVVSDPARRADAYMTLENHWDAMTYLVVIPAASAVAGNDVVAQHRLLADLDRTIVHAYPQRYARWWLLAIRRGIWGSVANILMHPVFLAVVLLTTGVLVLRCVWPPYRNFGWMSAPTGDDAIAHVGAQRAFFLLAISYAAAKLSFVALTSPTIGRFSDAAFVFLPSLAAIWICSRWMALPPAGVVRQNA